MNPIAVLIALAIMAVLFYVLIYLPWKAKQDQLNEGPSSAPPGGVPEAFTNYATYKHKTFSRKY